MHVSFLAEQAKVFKVRVCGRNIILLVDYLSKSDMVLNIISNVNIWCDM